MEKDTIELTINLDQILCRIAERRGCDLKELKMKFTKAVESERHVSAEKDQH